MIFVIAALVGIWIALFSRPDRRFGYATGAFVSMLVLAPSTLVSPAEVMGASVLMTAVSVSTALRPIRVTRLMMFYVLIVLVGLLSALFSGVPSQFASIVAVTTLVPVFTTATLSDREWSVVRFAVIATGGAVAALCLVEVFLVDAPLFAEASYGTNPILESDVRAQATVGHPLVAAMVQLFALGILLAAKVGPLAKIFLAVALLIGIVATGSTSAVLAALLCVISFFVFAGRARWWVFRVVLVGLAGVLAVGASVVPSSLGSDISGNNATHRINSLLAIPRLLQRGVGETIFGSGWGSQESLYRRGVLINDGFFAVDNQFTTVLAACGVIGAIALAVLLVKMFVRARGGEKAIVLSMTLMFVSFDVLNWVATGALYILLVALVTRKDNPAPQLPPKSMRSADRRESSVGRPRVI